MIRDSWPRGTHSILSQRERADISSLPGPKLFQLSLASGFCSVQGQILISCWFLFTYWFISLFANSGVTDTPLPFSLSKFSLILDILCLCTLNVSTYLARPTVTIDRRDRLPDGRLDACTHYHTAYDRDRHQFSQSAGLSLTLDTPDDKSGHNLIGGPFAVIECDPGVLTTLVRTLGA